MCRESSVKSVAGYGDQVQLQIIRHAQTLLVTSGQTCWLDCPSFSKVLFPVCYQHCCCRISDRFFMLPSNYIYLTRTLVQSMTERIDINYCIFGSAFIIVARRSLLYSVRLRHVFSNNYDGFSLTSRPSILSIVRAADNEIWWKEQQWLPVRL